MKVKQVNGEITHDYLEGLLRARGVEDVHRFLNPTREDIQSWRDLANINDGVKLIVDTLFSERPYALVVD